MSDTQNTDDYKPFSFEDYQQEITSEDFRKTQIKRLTENYRLQKSLERENYSILLGFSDLEKKEKLFNTVSKVYVGVLEADTIDNTIEDIVSYSLDTEESIKFLYDHRNSQHFPSGKVFEEHLEHPTQKLLTKSGHIGKRGMNKQKTPMQTLNFVYSAKSNSDRDFRLKEIEKSLAEAHYMISLLAVNQVETTLKVDQQNTQLSEVKHRLSLVEDKIKDQRKLKLYALYTSDKKPSTKELSKELGMDVRTIQRWLKELRGLNLIT